MLKIIKSTFHLTKSIIVGLILACIVTFMVNNREKITIHLFPLPFTIETRLFILMIACFLLGLGCGILLLSRNIINNAISNWKHSRKIKSEKSVDLQS